MGKIPLVSIIVPVYNVKPYLSQCLDSIIGQVYQNIEIIIVDDGSTDGCADICDEYKHKDERVVVVHKRNEGLSSARNSGMSLATGKYITFIDSDDMVSNIFVSDIMKVMVETGADIGVSDYNRFNEKNCLKDSINSESEVSEISNKCFSAVECLKCIYKSDVHGMNFVAWGKIYKRSLFTDNDIYYPNGKIHEDTFTTYKVVYRAQKVCFANESLYYYRVREKSIMNCSFGKKNLVALEATRETCDFFEQHKERELLTLASNYHIRLLFKDYIRMRKSLEFSSKEIKAYRKMMRKDVDEYLEKSDIIFPKSVTYKLVSRIPNSPITKLVALK